MDEERIQTLPVAPYPAPPPFWKHFTAKNVERARDTESDTDLPLDLTFLRPPPPPAKDAESYKTFSASWPLDPTPAMPPPEIILFDPNSPTFNHARALKQLTNSLLLNFLELIGVLSNNPIKYEEKMHDIERLMLNVHFVINLYRPHQAREGVKEMLQDQLDNGLQEIQKCEEMKQRVEKFLREIEQQTSESKPNGRNGSTKTDDQSNKQLWDLIHSLKDD